MKLALLWYSICLLIALFPVLSVEHPPLLDYPNHLARLYILTHPGDEFLAGYYRIDWELNPNLGFDVMAYALAQLLPVELAGRVFLAISIAIVLCGPMVMHRALYGRYSVMPLMCGTLLFNLVLQNGFLGYYLGLA